jgi:hypothetical protein
MHIQTSLLLLSKLFKKIELQTQMAVIVRVAASDVKGQIIDLIHNLNNRNRNVLAAVDWELQPRT